jgi:hypothetical protein
MVDVFAYVLQTSRVYLQCRDQPDRGNEYLEPGCRRGVWSVVGFAFCPLVSRETLCASEPSPAVLHLRASSGSGWLLY